MQYLQCPFDDDDTSLSLQRQKAMDLVSSARQAGGRVLMFCGHDWHGAVCMMYLMWECRLTLLQALSLVQYKKSQLKISRRLCVSALVALCNVLCNACSICWGPRAGLFSALMSFSVCVCECVQSHSMHCEASVHSTISQCVVDALARDRSLTRDLWHVITALVRDQCCGV